MAGWTHREHVIAIDDNGRFRITEGPHLDGMSVWHESLSQAREAIDKQADKAAKASRVKLSLPALDKDGKPVTITGIHAGHDTLLGVGDTDEVYPQVPWITTALKRRAELRREAGRLNAALSRHTIKRNRRLRRQTGGYEDMAEMIARLEQDHARITAEAERNAPPAGQAAA